jgi:hypothetical protein
MQEQQEKQRQQEAIEQAKRDAVAAAEREARLQRRKEMQERHAARSPSATAQMEEWCVVVSIIIQNGIIIIISFMIARSLPLLSPNLPFSPSLFFFFLSLSLSFAPRGADVSFVPERYPNLETIHKSLVEHELAEIFREPVTEDIVSPS